MKGRLDMLPVSHVKGVVHVRNGWLVPVAALAGFGACLQLSATASARPRNVQIEQQADPAVIPGIGAEEAQKLFPAPVPEGSRLPVPRPFRRSRSGSPPATSVAALLK